MGSKDIAIKPVTTKPRNFAVSPPNTDTSITLLSARGRWVLGTILWSYGASPTAGRLTVAGGGWAIDIDITDSGPGFIPMTPEPGKANDDTDVVITLHAAGAAVVGKLNLLGVRLE